MSEVEITQILLTRIVLPHFHPEAPGTDEVYAFLVRDRDECILFDTGVGTDSLLINRLYQPDHVDIEKAIQEAGASLGEVTAIANSHLHFDHCGNNSLFPDIPIYVQQSEWEAARTPHYTVPEWVVFPDARYITVRGRHRLSEHLELIPTPGHTPGHQSLIAHTSDRVELIAAQAAYTAAEFQLFCASGTDAFEDRDFTALQSFVQSNAAWSQQSYVDSLTTLQQMGPERAFFSHDSEAWESRLR